MSARRSAVVATAIVLAVLAARVEPAAACSCALQDPRTSLADADAAFVGALVERRENAGAVTLVFRIERVEINEAFSSVALNSTRLLGAGEEIVNVNGGAVALGHPIGASGGRIVATMVHELRRNGGGLGLAAICSGGGQGDALLIEV